MKKDYLRNYSNSQELIDNIRRHKMKKVFRRRRIGVVIATFLLVCILVSGVVFAASSGKDVSYAPVEVVSGDSLWNLAKKYYPDCNPRDGVYKIMEANNMIDSTIYEGDILMLPIVE